MIEIYDNLKCSEILPSFMIHMEATTFRKQEVLSHKQERATKHSIHKMILARKHSQFTKQAHGKNESLRTTISLV